MTAAITPLSRSQAKLTRELAPAFGVYSRYSTGRPNGRWNSNPVNMAVAPLSGLGLAVQCKRRIHLAVCGVVSDCAPFALDPGVRGEWMTLDADDQCCVESAS